MSAAPATLTARPVRAARRAAAPPRRLWWVLCLPLLAGCATYSARVADLRPDLAAGRYDNALKVVEDNRKGKDLLLYHLERGLVLHYADRWQESNDAFQAAEELAADLYTRSISEAAFSLLLNDNTIAYRAEPFEMAMIPYYRALNYALLGERDGALVEARKASLYLRQYAELDLGALGDLARAEDPDRDELLSNNAFLHYFSALVYEWGGEHNDAFIAYRHAADAYAIAARRLAVQPPPWLGEDLERTGARLGFGDELRQLRDAFPELMAGAAEAAAATAAAPPAGEVVLLLELGYVPPKRQQELNVPILKTDQGRDRDRWARDLWGRTRPGWSAGKTEIVYWLRAAVPSLQSARPTVRGAHVSAELAGTHAAAAVVEDVEGRALLGFEAKQPAIYVKTFARALAKYGATRGARKEGKAAGLFANLLGAATETADTRSWLTLPNQIAMARLRLPPGEHDLRVDLLDGEGRTLETRAIAGVHVRAGDRVFLSRRAF